MSKEAAKYDPFLKQHLGADYIEVPFEDLQLSTATMDVRMHERTQIQYRALFEDLPVIPSAIFKAQPVDTRWPAGTIIASKFEGQVKGTPPTTTDFAFKNSTMLWIWLEDKMVNVKVSSNNLHITGCKKIEHAAETARLLQMHIQLLIGHTGEEPLEPSKYYTRWPYALRFDVCMINYNFKLGVALDLPKFDIFVYENYKQFVFSSYDQNINGTSMPMKCAQLSITYTVNDNGQISMCTGEADIGISCENIYNGYKAFYVMAREFRAHTQQCFVQT